MIRSNTIQSTWRGVGVFCLLFAQLLTSCGSSSDSQHLETANNLYNFDITVKTADTSYGEDQSYPNNVTFVLKIAEKNRKDLIQSLIARGHFSSEDQAIHFLSFELLKNVRVQSTSGVVFNPLFFHFERSFDLKKERVFLTSFDLSQARNAETLKLLINSPVFGNEAVEFDISKLEIYKS
ncbi:MAG: hypothetical protein AAFO69_03225 [Bacteroidota bacterium]